MTERIVLYDKSRTELGNVRLEGQALKLERGQLTEEVAAALASMLESIEKDAGVKTRRAETTAREDGSIVRIQKIETVPMSDPKFLVALKDRLNRMPELKGRVFAVFQSNGQQSKGGQSA